MKSSDERMTDVQPLGAPIRKTAPVPVQQPRPYNADGTIVIRPDGRLETNLPSSAPTPVPFSVPDPDL